MGSAIVAIAIVGRGGWAGLSSTVAIQISSTLWQMIWSSTMLENVSSVTLWHKEGHVVDGTIRNVVYAFIWFSFATVYGRLPLHLSPLWQLPLWQLPLFPSVAQFPCVYLGSCSSIWDLKYTFSIWSILFPFFWPGHVRNTLFHFCQLWAVNYQDAFDAIKIVQELRCLGTMHNSLYFRVDRV